MVVISTYHQLSDVELADLSCQHAPIMKLAASVYAPTDHEEPLAVAQEATPAHKVKYPLSALRDCCGNHAGI